MPDTPRPYDFVDPQADRRGKPTMPDTPEMAERKALFEAGRATGTVEGWADYTPAQGEPMTELSFPTTDAMEWVKAFRERNPDANVDDGTMLAWFANAIEHGRGPDPVKPHDA
jgi:hypothetical protein